MASDFVFAGQPDMWGDRLVWGGTLDPGAMRTASAHSWSDMVYVVKLTSDDAAGLSEHSYTVEGFPRMYEHPQDVEGGESYEANMDLGIGEHPGYYHVMVSLDSDNDGPTYELHVRVEDGRCEVKSAYVK